ncbi:MAG TPA: hypothetical protein VLB87_16090, partial [Pyrinomonadaceae bacterium]|nr:hypothetical protein [Pyrinomonadaceae bacterium]
MHLAARLRELEAEADAVRAELAEMDTLASQTEAAIYRLLSSVLASSNLSLGLPSDAELEAAMRQSQPAAHPRSSVFTQPPPYTQPEPQPPYTPQSQPYTQQRPYTQPPVHNSARTQTPPPERRQPI